MIKSNIEDISTDDLKAELGRRFDAERAEQLTMCIETCPKCRTSSHLTKWTRLNTYHFEDDFYTQNYIQDDNYYIICPNCRTPSCCRKTYYKDSIPDNAATIELDRYERMGKFMCLGKFDKVYEQYNRGYGHTSEYYIKDENYKRIEVENPFK